MYFWHLRGSPPDVAVYRSAETWQAELVANALQAANLRYFREAEAPLGLHGEAASLPDEGQGELFYVPADRVEEARGVLASLPFPPPDGQPTLAAPSEARSGALYRPVPNVWAFCILAVVVLAVMVCIVMALRRA